jgi:poly(A) polymerase
MLASVSKPQIEIEPPAESLDLASAYAAAGFSLYLVGGWVRDAVRGRPSMDMDFATDASPDDSLKVLRSWTKGEVWTTGIEFGTVSTMGKAGKLEVTTFRTETYPPDSRKPKVEFRSDLEEDLARRDFTINALALELPGGSVPIDPYGGLADIAGQRIRTPLSPEVAFTDDPLRMLRAFRFVSTLGFDVDQAVMDAIGEMAARLEIVAPDRIKDEFVRLMEGAKPSRALDLAASSGLAEQFLPELVALQLEQDPIHRHKDVFRHTLQVLDNVASTDSDDPDLVLRLAALLHDIGKPATRRIDRGGVSFHHHEVVGAEMTEERLKALRIPSKTIEDVRDLVYMHLRFHTYRGGWSDAAVRRYVRDAGGQLGRLNTLVRADCTTRNRKKAFELNRRMDELEARIAELAAKEELGRMRPALDGNEIMEHLGLNPGPQVGDAIDYLMEIRLDEGEITKQQAVARLEKWWASRSG